MVFFWNARFLQDFLSKSNHHGGCGVDMMFPCVLEFLDDAFTITARLINAVSFGPIY